MSQDECKEQEHAGQRQLVLGRRTCRSASAHADPSHSRDQTRLNALPFSLLRLVLTAAAMVRPRVFFDFSIDNAPVGRYALELP